ITSLFVENRHGPTSVQSWDRSSVLVAATRTGSDRSALEEELAFETTPSSLRVSVRVTNSMAAPNIKIFVPATVQVTVRGGKSPVVLRDLSAGLMVETDSGGISLHLSSDANADLSLRAFEGSIESSIPVTAFGRVESQSLDGRVGKGGSPIILRTLRGNISLLPTDSRQAAAAPSTLRRPADVQSPDSRRAPVLVRERTSGADPDSNLTARLRELHSTGPPVLERATATTAPESKPDGDEVLRLEARLVNLNVKVTDTAGRSIRDLKRADFNVLEDNVPQDVSYFEPVASPVNLVLLLDLSGSTRDKLNMIKRAGKSFVDSLRKDDHVAIAYFTTRFYVASGFTSDRNLLKDRIDEIGNRGGDTAFFDATWTALDLFQGARDTRKAIVILTDGVDSSMSEGERERGSTRTFDELLMRIVEEDTTVYPIYLDTEYELVVRDRSYTHEIFSTARKQLEVLAEQTGGALFKAAQIEDLEGVYDLVASELHALYSIGYHSKDTRKEGKWRRISVKVGRQGAIARSKRGYFAK
ncbi:MAG TPA: VWA domain-containing protein, partial [Blastocatellia bacterium]|nr:VWA domain-containing protein [Blastocatellia bacterium]